MLLAHSDQIRHRIGEEDVDMGEEEEPERAKSMSASDGEWQHPRKEAIEKISHEAYMELEDQN